MKIATAKAVRTEGVPPDLVREIELYCFHRVPEVASTLLCSLRPSLTDQKFCTYKPTMYDRRGG
jgi:hypothetical protein